VDHNPKILVIDDEAIMRDGSSRILAKEDMDVITAENGEAGLALIKDAPDGYDVMLLDLMMPGMSGMEVLEHVRVMAPSIHVIVVTGYATVDTAVEAMKKGAYDFIPKPFTPDQLRIVVHRALEKKALEEEAERLREEAKKSLKDVATEKSKTHTIINSMTDGVLVVDRDGSVALLNPAATRFLSVSADEVLGEPIDEISVEELTHAIKEVLEKETENLAGVSQEIQLQEDGREVFLRCHAVPVKDEEGALLGGVAVLQDITQLKELERMKADFVAMVTHELRAPVAAIEQQLTVILKGLAGEINERQSRMLGRAKERAKGLLDLVKDLLDLSKIEAGIQVQYMEPVDIGALLSKVVDLMQIQAEQKGLTLEFELEKGLPFVKADATNIEGVFTNLISNAIKYTPEGRLVRVTGEREGDYIRVDVQDTGIGISEKDLPRIFERFYRVKTEKTRQIIGTGLGLSIVKQVVDTHLGTIDVQSVENQGTRFTVRLPVISKK